VIGIVLIFVPQVMGVGYEYVDQALNGGMLLRMMLLLCAVKLAATIISYSSGNAGGIFAPSLYLGAMAGGVVGTLVHQYSPFPTAAPGAYALVGMGTLFAGIIRAPMTSVFMIFELTQDYQILVPLMIANLLSFVISRRFQRQPVYHALLEQTHIYLPGTEARSGSVWRAKDIMMRDLHLIPDSVSIDDASALIREDRASTFLVGRRDHLQGIITRKLINAAIQDGKGAETLGSITSHHYVYLFADQPLETALELFGSNPDLLPVLSRNGNRSVVGVITLDTILEFIHKKPE
jgi:CIC family chloride channel protein